MPRADHPLAYRVPEAARMVGVSKSKMWALISERRVEARKIGGSTVVTHAALQALLDDAPLVASPDAKPGQRRSSLAAAS